MRRSCRILLKLKNVIIIFMIIRVLFEQFTSIIEIWKFWKWIQKLWIEFVFIATFCISFSKNVRKFFCKFQHENSAVKKTILFYFFCDFFHNFYEIYWSNKFRAKNIFDKIFVNTILFSFSRFVIITQIFESTIVWIKIQFFFKFTKNYIIYKIFYILFLMSFRFLRNYIFTIS